MTKNFQELLISPSTKVIDAMRVIEKGDAKIALVVNKERILEGTLTDGDIRRGLLNGETLNTPAERLMNKKFRCEHDIYNREEIIQRMKREGLHQMPIVNEQGQVHELLVIDDLLEPKQIENAVIIMAGGKGMRLRPYTENCPKPMLPIDGKPMLEILIEQFKSRGFSNFYISVNYLKEQIMEYFGGGEDWNVNIKYLVEKEPMGTAGCLQLLPKTIGDSFLVINGDVLTRLDPDKLLRFHRENKGAATICVREYVTNIPFGVVKTEGTTLVNIEEKPTYRELVNAGVYVIDPILISLLKPKEATDMPTLIRNAQQQEHKIAVCPIHEYWIDVGRPETLREAHATWEQ